MNSSLEEELYRLKLSRRDFLKTVGIIVGGSLALGNFNSVNAQTPKPQGSEKTSDLDTGIFRKNSMKTFKEAYDVQARSDIVTKKFKDMRWTFPRYFIPSKESEISPEEIDAIKTGFDYVTETFQLLEESNKAQIFMYLDGALKGPKYDKDLEIEIIKKKVEALENSGHLQPDAIQSGIYPYQEFKRIEELIDKEIEFIKSDNYSELIDVYNKEKEELEHVIDVLKLTEILGSEDRFMVQELEIFKWAMISLFGFEFSFPSGFGSIVKKTYPIRDLSKTALDYVQLDKKYIESRLKQKKCRKPDFVYKELLQYGMKGKVEFDKDTIVFGDSVRIKIEFEYKGREKLYGSPHLQLRRLEPPYRTYLLYLTKDSKIVQDPKFEGLRIDLCVPEYWWIEPMEKLDYYIQWTYNDKNILPGRYLFEPYIEIPYKSETDRFSITKLGIGSVSKEIKFIR